MVMLEVRWSFGLVGRVRGMVEADLLNAGFGADWWWGSG